MDAGALGWQSSYEGKAKATKGKDSAKVRRGKGNANPRQNQGEALPA